MRKLLALISLAFALALAPGTAKADQTRYYQFTSTSGSTTATFNFGSNQIAGDFILVKVYPATGSLPTTVSVSDQEGNTYTEKVNTSTLDTFLATGIAAHTNETITVTFSSSPSNTIDIQAYEVNHDGSTFADNNGNAWFLTSGGDAWLNGGGSGNNIYLNGQYTNGGGVFVLNASGTIYSFSTNGSWYQYAGSLSWTKLSSPPNI